MTPERREESIFEEALRLPADQRAAFLGGACRGDTEMRVRLERLLSAFERAGGFMQEPAAPHRSPGIPPAPTERPGDYVGRYKLLEQIGEGGCGRVYVAEQEAPVRRRVALKLIKLGMDTRQVIARFEAERQALALMEHPNIAKVLEAGATDTGRPYFVMELVRGIKITDFCDQNQLTAQERLNLFIQVCRAIQHAHQKGIIHRDIKPSNILVTLHDGAPVPKVIDFGIAKATQGRLTDDTVYTAFQQFIGTPAYMSPEQAEMSGLDIDTRSDIYSLGVLLYELLTGRTPFDAKALAAAGLDAMRRTIREEEPLKPSTKLGAMEREELTTTARLRHTESPKLIHLLRGDLDWIVMKALEKDRTRRYETANGLATDLLRHLENEPVLACPPSKLYRLRKFAGRNKLAVAAGMVVAVALCLGVIASTWQAIRAAHAEQAQIQLRKQAEIEAEKATAISDFLQTMLRSANPDALKGSEYTVRQLLDDFSTSLTNQLQAQPEVESAVRATVGRAYYRLGITKKAQQQIERALALHRRVSGDRTELYAATLVDYAWVCFEQRQFRKGENQARNALAIYRERGVSGRPVISALWVLQKILAQEGRFDEVAAVTKEALAIADKVLGGECPELASVLHGMAEVANQRGDYDAGAEFATRAVELQRRLRGAEHPETAWALVSLEVAQRGRHKLAEAEAAGREALRVFRRNYPPGHKSVTGALAELKEVLTAKGDAAGVEALEREQRLEEGVAPGTEELRLANSLHEFAVALQQGGNLAMAESAYRHSLALKRKFVGDESPTVPWSLCGLGSVLQQQGKLPEAEALFREALQIQRTLLDGGNIYVAESFIDSLNNLLSVLALQNKPAEADEAVNECLPVILHPPGRDYAQLPSLMAHVARVLQAQGRAPEAQRAYEDSIQGARHALGATNEVVVKLVGDYEKFQKSRSGKL